LITYGGSYECNPPFDDQLFHVVVPLLLQALTMCTLPLSIALVLPTWKWSKGLAFASESQFCRGRLEIPNSDHAYMHGLQHCCKSKDRIWNSDPKFKGWGSVVFLLQNDAGVARFPVTEEGLARHRACWGLK